MFATTVSERNAALSALDMEYARRIMPDASSDYVRLISMHKARYECTSLPASLRHSSGMWLRQRGLKRMTGDAVLPEGVLPA
jgi:hypothetical protein